MHYSGESPPSTKKPEAVDASTYMDPYNISLIYYILHGVSKKHLYLIKLKLQYVSKYLLILRKKSDPLHFYGNKKLSRSIRIVLNTPKLTPKIYNLTKNISCNFLYSNVELQPLK